jgi:hypothetical protein
MAQPGAEAPEERKIRSRLRQLLLARRGMLHGSLVLMKRKCGGANCRCTRGELHESWYLSIWEDGRTRMVYIPKAWEHRVREWVERDKEVRALLLDLSRQHVEKLRQRKE